MATETKTLKEGVKRTETDVQVVCYDSENYIRLSDMIEALSSQPGEDWELHVPTFVESLKRLAERMDVIEVGSV